MYFISRTYSSVVIEQNKSPFNSQWECTCDNLTLIPAVAVVEMVLESSVEEGQRVNVCAVITEPDIDCPVAFSFIINVVYEYGNGAPYSSKSLHC